MDWVIRCWVSNKDQNVHHGSKVSEALTECSKDFDPMSKIEIDDEFFCLGQAQNHIGEGTQESQAWCVMLAALSHKGLHSLSS